LLTIIALRIDLGAVWQVSDADRRLISIASRQLAYTAAKLVTAHDAGTADALAQQQTADVLHRSLELASSVDALVARKPITDDDSSLPPPPLDLDSGTKRELSYEPDLFPLFDHVAFQSSTAGLEGPAQGFPEYRPCNFLEVQDVADSFETAVAAMRHVDRYDGVFAL
jgi:hypothetical protein